MASSFLKVEFKAEKALKGIEKRYGKANISLYATRALALAADRTVVPAVRAEAPSGDNSSPWRRGATRYGPDTRRMARYPGPMRDKVHVYKRVKKRGPDEAAVVVVGIQHYALMAVVRGTKSHKEPQHWLYHGDTNRHPQARPHPGSKGNDIFGRALKRSRSSLVKAVAAEMKRI